jgi:hypothetical protein
MIPSRLLIVLAALTVSGDAFSIKDPSRDSRRAFVETIVATTASVIAGTMAPAPAIAVGGKSKVNNKLLSFGLPPAVIPEGLTPLCHIYGKGKNRFPILVTFSHPVDWVVTYPNNDANGEDGTVQAGEYAKGDSATFFVFEEPGNVKVRLRLVSTTYAYKKCLVITSILPS